MTNRQWLESLSDEEFIKEYPVSCAGYPVSCACCPARKICDKTTIPCNEVLKIWLRQEHKEDDPNVF